MARWLRHTSFVLLYGQRIRGNQCEAKGKAGKQANRSHAVDASWEPGERYRRKDQPKHHRPDALTVTSGRAAFALLGHEAQEHRDTESAAQQTTKAKAKKPSPQSKKEAAQARQAQTNAASLWGDGTMPFGKKKPKI